jgi:hypothetical protein
MTRELGTQERCPRDASPFDRTRAFQSSMLGLGETTRSMSTHTWGSSTSLPYQPANILYFGPPEHRKSSRPPRPPLRGKCAGLVSR